MTSSLDQRRQQLWRWLEFFPGRAILLAPVIAGGVVFLVITIIWALVFCLTPASVAGCAMGAAYALALAFLVVALPVDMGLPYRLVGPLAYSLVLGPQGEGISLAVAAAYVTIEVAGRCTGHRRLLQLQAVARWMPDQLVALFPVRNRAAKGKAQADSSTSREPVIICRPAKFILLGLVMAGGFLRYAPVLSAGFFPTPAREDARLLQVVARHGLAGAYHYFSPTFFPRELAPAMTYYRPIALLSYAVDYTLWDGNPSGWHLSSLLVHLAVAAALIGVLARITGNWVAAAAAGGLFALSPASQPAVCWVAARMDLLCAAFALAAFYFVSSFLEKGGAGRWAAALGLATGAALSKETGLILVPIAAAWCLLSQDAPDRRRRVVMCLSLGLLPLCYAALRLWTHSWTPLPEEIYPGWQWPRWAHLLGFFVLPEVTRAVEAIRHGVLSAVDVPGLVALLVAVGLLRNKWRAAVVFLLWKGLFFLPALGFPEVAPWRQYAADVGTFALTGLLIAQAMATAPKVPGARWGPVAVAAVYILQYARALQPR